MPTSDEIAGRLDALRSRLASVERTWSHPIGVVAVTKGFPPDLVPVAVDAGCDRIGENYAQELRAKAEVIDALGARRPRVDFIGRLQSNKVRMVTGVVDRWCTVDRASLAKEIAKRDPGATVLVQVNSTGEPQKGGCDPAEVPALVERCGELGLAVEGLLTVGPTERPPEAARPGFELVRSLVDDLGLATCSMGMSADLEVAVAAGTTEVRVGTALFGPRPAPTDTSSAPSTGTSPAPSADTSPAPSTRDRPA